MAKKGSLAKKVSEMFTLPDEAVSDLPKLEISVLGKVSVENHKGLLTYTEEIVEISGGKVVIVISGSGMQIRAMTAELLTITGEIFKVEFLH